MTHLHPYDELLLNERLNLKPRSRVHPIVTAPLSCRVARTRFVAHRLHHLANFLRIASDPHCCAAPSA